MYNTCNYVYNNFDLSSMHYLQWVSDGVNDMYADAVLSVILKLSTDTKKLESKNMPDQFHIKQKHFACMLQPPTQAL